jgi:DNA modification methylase
MDIANLGSRWGERSLTDKLKAKGRRRREDLERLRSSSRAWAPRNDPLPSLDLVYVPLENLRSPSREVRKLDPANVREVAYAIGTLGFCAPILIGKENAVIDGLVRVEAARQIGLDRVPCVRIEHLSETEQRTLRLAVNRLGEKGEWNLEELKIEFEELIVANAPIEASGFALDEIDHIVLNEVDDAVEEGPLSPEAGAIAVARIGDVFELGPHRVVCGSVTDPAALRILMQDDALARLVLTDEPYNVPIAGHVTGGRHREFAMASGEMTDAQFLAFNEAWMSAVLPYLCDAGVFGTFIDWRGCPTVHSAAVKLGLNPLNLVVWTKTNAGMGSLYRSQHELLPLFKKGSAPHVNNVELGKRGRWRSNVWIYPGASSLGSDARRGLEDHPTVKPTAMLKDALLDLTHRGDLVVDPFLGSGSMLIAAEQTGRVCRGMELDPLYVDVMVRRYEAATGKGDLCKRGICERSVRPGVGEPVVWRIFLPSFWGRGRVILGFGQTPPILARCENAGGAAQVERRGEAEGVGDVAGETRVARTSPTKSALHRSEDRLARRPPLGDARVAAALPARQLLLVLVRTMADAVLDPRPSQAPPPLLVLVALVAVKSPLVAADQVISVPGLKTTRRIMFEP